MTPSELGPYRLLEPLGQGGMGVVYRAVHLRTGRSAAVKTVQLAREGMLQSLRREIRTLARIRHPGIVRILDEGLHEGLPWYAMELLDGRTLRSSVRQPGQAPPEKAQTLAQPTRAWWTRSLEQLPGTSQPLGRRLAASPTRGSTQGPDSASQAWLRPVLTLARRLCAPLAFLHGEGIVHRDLKPDNVLLRPDGMPVLVDFGLVSQFSVEVSREALETGAATGGTVAYMAPEQIEGQLVDARADLYALGCILYELLVGRPPFVSGDPREILQQHLEVPPLAPSELCPDLPPELDELLLRLLAKSPHDRHGYADDVAAALTRLGAEDGLADAGPKPRTYLYRPSFAGRQEALGLLEAHLERLQQGSGALVLIAGESGVGKTRLALELALKARKTGVAVHSGECLPPGEPGPSAASGTAGPLHPLRKTLQSLGDRCRARGLTETQRLFGQHGRLLALYEPALSGLPGEEAYPEPAALPPAAAQQRLYAALTELFQAEASRAPLLLVIDDLQWSDELTLGFLEHWLRSNQHRAQQAAPLQPAGSTGIGDGGMPLAAPLLVVGTYRAEEVGPGLRRLIEAPGAVDVALGRLDEGAVRTLVGDMLALHPAPQLFSRFLARHSEGNPFFVAEYLRAAVAEQLLGRDEQGSWQIAASGQSTAAEAGFERLALPSSLRELVGRHLDQLSAEARHVVEAAAILGREMEERLLTKVAGLRDASGLDPVEELLARQILEEGAAGRLRFLHDKVREVAYGRMAPERRPELHRASAEALEALPEQDRLERLAELGRHWQAAGDRLRAGPCYLAAARQAWRRHALDEAERLYLAFLGLRDQPDSESIDARNELGRNVLYPQGRTEESLAQHRLALEEARRIGSGLQEGRSLLEVGILLLNTGRAAEARASYEQALALSRAAGDRPNEALVLGNLATLHAEQGRPEEAEELHRQGLALARELKNRRYEGMMLGNLANLVKNQGQLDEARNLYQQALLIKRQLGDRRSEATTLMNLGNLHDEQEDFQKAQALYDEALAIFREVGDRRWEAMVLSSLGFLVGRTDPVRAASQLQQALDLHREVGGRLFEGITLRYLAILSRRSGEIGEAEQALHQAEATLLELGNTLEHAFCLCQRGFMTLAGQESARQLLERLEQLAASLDIGPGSPLAREIARLQRAVERFEAGRSFELVRGECIEDVPELFRPRERTATKRRIRTSR